MKFRIQARLCSAIYDFEARIMLNFSRYQTTDVRDKFNSNVAAKFEYIFSDFYWSIILVKGRLVSLANAYNSLGMIKFIEKFSW